MRWLTDADGFPRLERCALAVSAPMAAIGWALAIWVDPGAINMAAGGTIALIGTAVVMAVMGVRRWCRRTR
jgi:hypothetical protein